MRLLIILFGFLFLTSCGTYRVSTTPKVKIAKILTITSTGDTLAVPMRDFQKYNFNTYDFNRFNFNNSLYWNSWQHPYFGWGYGWNNWNTPFQPYYHDWWYRPIHNRPLIRPEIHPTNNRQPIRVRGRRGSLRNENESNSIDGVIRNLENRGIRVRTNQIPNNPIQNYTPSQNNYSPAPRVRVTSPPPQRTPRVQSTPNVQIRSNGGRRSIKQ